MKLSQFKEIPPQGNGAYKYICPKGHIVNCLSEPKPYDYRCPVCEGMKPTISENLQELNKKYIR